MTEQGHPVDYLPELALGVLREGEAGPIREHLATCETCQAEYRELERVALLLPFGAEDAAPPPEMREAVFARINSEPRLLQPRPIRRWQWVAGVAAAASVLVVAGGLVGFLFRGGRDDAGDELRLQAAVVEAAAQGTLFVARGSQDGTEAAVVRAPGATEAFLWLEALPPLPEGKAYQAWFTRDGQTFEPSAVFTDATHGAWAAAEGAIEQYAAMGLTIEDSGGAPAPTMSPFVVVDLTRAVRFVP